MAIKRNFDICVGSNLINWSDNDVIDLYDRVQQLCFSQSFSNFYLRDRDTESIMLFDRYERFSVFSAEPDVLDRLYPFSRTVMWEHFAISQDEDIDYSLTEVFSEIYRRPS
ncbi:MAG: hypothetical protein KF730_05600 [Sphingomonas sp.]|uniref:hypothetical protein n=1 Tax=Sphingomonas sp. TaxID=28214 RepID=UPI0025E1467F|nr:hypothetical protein [Sphingomonas sp.]MBX3564036.1 hypothetical protein [Sphingomonas sp.]